MTRLLLHFCKHTRHVIITILHPLPPTVPLWKSYLLFWTTKKSPRKKNPESLMAFNNFHVMRCSTHEGQRWWCDSKGRGSIKALTKGDCKRCFGNIRCIHNDALLKTAFPESNDSKQLCSLNVQKISFSHITMASFTYTIHLTQGEEISRGYICVNG